VIEEDHSRTYRRAIVEPLADRLPEPSDRTAVVDLRSKLHSLLSPAVERHTGGEPEAVSPYAKATSAMTDEDLVNALSQYLDLEPLEKLALLQHDTVRARAESLVELLEMKILMARSPCSSSVAH
jgi:Lon protease-like protein